MKKQSLTERFKQLAGIKPLYEQEDKLKAKPEDDEDIPLPPLDEPVDEPTDEPIDIPADSEDEIGDDTADDLEIPQGYELEDPIINTQDLELKAKDLGVFDKLEPEPEPQDTEFGTELEPTDDLEDPTKSNVMDIAGTPEWKSGRWTVNLKAKGSRKLNEGECKSLINEQNQPGLNCCVNNAYGSTNCNSFDVCTSNSQNYAPFTEPCNNPTNAGCNGNCIGSCGPGARSYLDYIMELTIADCVLGLTHTTNAIVCPFSSYDPTMNSGPGHLMIGWGAGECNSGTTIIPNPGDYVMMGGPNNMQSSGGVMKVISTNLFTTCAGCVPAGVYTLNSTAGNGPAACTQNNCDNTGNSICATTFLSPQIISAWSNAMANKACTGSQTYQGTINNQLPQAISLLTSNPNYNAGLNNPNYGWFMTLMSNQPNHGLLTFLNSSSQISYYANAMFGTGPQPGKGQFKWKLAKVLWAQCMMQQCNC
jgi:hypothetical protein